ncbi:hypothetical protein [Archangium sp.]|uniref:hypothetical protein n=1 Tax=Archangium sp. TaxID=1872627 RepID=UPI002D576063|nr:hypothetical protein [Archangium sp.]HYO57213.1 hypothetical protein [Archangium sp.]
MDELFSAGALVELVRRYYPRGLYGDDPQYRESKEYQRLRDLHRKIQEDDATWQRFLQRVREQIPECTVYDMPGLPYDPSRRVRVYLPDSPLPTGEHKAVVAITSILAPVHILHASHEKVDLDEELATSQTWFPPFPPEFQPYEAKLDALVRDSFGSVRLPNDVLFTPVQDLQIGNYALGEGTLIHYLFTDNIW